nr:MAG TPA: holin [Myoviridae sp. ctEXz2]
MEIFADGTRIVMFIGLMAFLVSVITEVLKKWEWLDRKMPTQLLTILLSLLLCPLAYISLVLYSRQVIDWFMVFASFLAAFIVAMVAMDGWERVKELADRFTGSGK